MPRSADVDAFLASLVHPEWKAIQHIRELIHAAVPDVNERIKWNAPSFGLGDEDRITMNFGKGDQLRIVFHRGVKVRNDPFTFDDRSGLLKMTAADRGVLNLKDLSDLETKRDRIQTLVIDWLAAAL